MSLKRDCKYHLVLYADYFSYARKASCLSYIFVRTLACILQPKVEARVMSGQAFLEGKLGM